VDIAPHEPGEFSASLTVAAGDYSLKKDIVVYSEKSVIKDDLSKLKSAIVSVIAIYKWYILAFFCIAHTYNNFDFHSIKNKARQESKAKERIHGRH